MSNYNGKDNLEVMSYAKKYNNYLINLILENINKEDRVLDFGAGLGYYAKIIKENNFDITCLEPNLFQNKIITKHGIQTFKNLDEIEDNSLDFIYSLNVLEHIEDDLKIVDILKKKLKKNGKLLIYVPAFNILYSSMDKKVGHYRRYSMKSLKNLMVENKLNIKKCRYVDSLGFFVTLLYKLIGNKNGKISKNSILVYDRVIFPVSLVLDKLFSKFFGKNIYLLSIKNP